MKQERIYTGQFLKLCISALLFITSFNLIVPELNNIMRDLGGADGIGLAWTISLFSFAALLARPFSGKLVDSVGRKPVILVGALICVILGLLYNSATSLVGFLLLRFIHGFSTGFTPVGNTSYVADISPAHRRGEVMGIMGMIVSLGFPIGMALGAFISERFNNETLFLVSSSFALMSVLLVSTLPETKSDTTRFNLSHLRVKISDFFDPRILKPFVVMALTIFSFGSLLIVIMDHAEYIGFSPENKSIFITVNVLTSIGIRFLAGKLSDKIGRRNVLIIGVSFTITALLLLANSTSQGIFIAAGVCYGFASGFNSPTIFAWAIDLSDPKKVGRAMSTLFVAVEIGIIMGSQTGGYIYDNDPINIVDAHYLSAIMASAALIFLLLIKNTPPTALLNSDNQVLRSRPESGDVIDL